MGAAKLAVLSLTLLLGLSAAANPPPAAAPAPAPDCMTIQLGLADCLSFVSNGTKDTKPSKSCCAGLQKALTPDVAAAQICLCQGFEQSPSLGIQLNITNARNLPKLCNVTQFSVDKCQLGPAAAPGPSGIPAVSPSGAPTPSSVPGIAPPPPPPPPTASSVPGTPPSGADAVSPNIAPSSPTTTSTSSRLGGSVQLLVCTAIFAAFLTSFS